ncbi:hypothetical protein [Methylocystis heyeri]|uniref:Alpha-amylase n=1 Tax=Methylocystis heyeri TaxID=391905 RepID=A0A6B8KA08_9HYPH|nr:hypothetical protein [Methylocystis heyeri]QGM44689.1 hypothetical protein H2LOC_002735 [Methylocystis heyeri]
MIVRALNFVLRQPAGNFRLRAADRSRAAALTLALLAFPGAARAMDQIGSGAAMDHSDAMSPMPGGATAGHGGSGMAGERIPAGVTGAYMVPAGEGMFNYTPTFMHMSGNYVGSEQVSPQTIASTIFSGQFMTMTMKMGGMGGMPMTKTMIMPVMLRIVPSSMDSQMHMFNGMYGLTDSINLMVMGSYAQKSMTMTTFAGMSGLAVLGQSSGSTEGFNDAMVGLNLRLYQDDVNHLQAGLALALPVGAQTSTIQMLSAMGGYMTMRAPYAMQIGTGTVDLVPTLAYTGKMGPWSWGAMFRGRYALDKNSEGYQFGASNELTGWGGYSFIPGVTATFRVAGSTQDHIHGQDPLINGLSSPANPLYYGGKRIDLLGGLAVSGRPFGLGMTILAVEAGGPVFQELNGPQLGKAWQISVAGRVMF